MTSRAGTSSRRFVVLTCISTSRHQHIHATHAHILWSIIQTYSNIQTYTHTHTHTYTYLARIDAILRISSSLECLPQPSLTTPPLFSLFLSLSMYLTQSHTHIHTRACAWSLSLSLLLSLSCSPSHPPSHPPSLSPAPPLILSLSRLLSYSIAS